MRKIFLNCSTDGCELPCQGIRTAGLDFKFANIIYASWLVRTGGRFIFSRLIPIGLLAIILSCGLASDSLAQTVDKKVQFYFFTNAACGPCRLVEPELETLFQEGYNVVKIDTAVYPDLSRQYQIAKTPTIVLLKDGQEVGRKIGLIDAAAMRQWHHSVADIRHQNLSAARGPQIRNRSEKLPATYLNGTYRPANSLENRAIDATVRLRIDDPQGSSFATGTVIHSIGGEALVLTCGHVFRDSKGTGSITAETDFLSDTKKTAPGELIFYDADARDIALVAIKTNSNIQPVPIAQNKTTINKGSDIFSIGCDQGDCPSIRHSKIKNLAKYDGVKKIEIYGRPINGRSGGGLFNDKGELIGVCNAAVVDADEGVYVGLDTVYWQFAEVNLQHLFPSATRPNVSPIENDIPQFAADNFIRQSVSSGRNLDEIPIRRSLAANSKYDLNNAVQTTPASLADKSELELIVVLKDRRHPDSTESWTLRNPSSELISQLKADSIDEAPIPSPSQRLAQLRRQMPDLQNGVEAKKGFEIRAQSRY